MHTLDYIKSRQMLFNKSLYTKQMTSNGLLHTHKHTHDLQIGEH